VPDDFSHEQSLVFETENGLVILNSCCHAGADTVIREVKDALPGRDVLAVFGGFHLMGLSGPDSMADKPEDIRALADRIAGLGVKALYTGHCTGGPAYEILKQELAEKLHYFSTGTVVEL
jgi:7,8-dihydropterin-6-yl-methyl-4-(beta-D-ribofuranosyl)aminobenzene 5'-phosphate synthase